MNHRNVDVDGERDSEIDSEKSIQVCASGDSDRRGRRCVCEAKTATTASFKIYGSIQKGNSSFRLGPGQVALFHSRRTPLPLKPLNVRIHCECECQEDADTFLLSAICFLHYAPCQRPISMISRFPGVCENVQFRLLRMMLIAKLPMAPLQPVSGCCCSETPGDCQGEWNAGPISITSWSTPQSLFPIKSGVGESGQCEVSKSPPDHRHLINRLFEHWLDRQQRRVLHAGPRNRRHHFRNNRTRVLPQWVDFVLNSRHCIIPITRAH